MKNSKINFWSRNPVFKIWYQSANPESSINFSNTLLFRKMSLRLTAPSLSAGRTVDVRHNTIINHVALCTEQSCFINTLVKCVMDIVPYFLLVSFENLLFHTNYRIEKGCCIVSVASWLGNLNEWCSWRGSWSVKCGSLPIKVLILKIIFW